MKVSLRVSVVALACAVSGVLGANIQSPFVTLPSDAAKNRQSVKNIFLTSWNAYKYVWFRTHQAWRSLTYMAWTTSHVRREIAFPHDDLTPISVSFTDGRNGWGASAVDALTTMVRIPDRLTKLSRN